MGRAREKEKKEKRGRVPGRYIDPAMRCRRCPDASLNPDETCREELAFDISQALITNAGLVL